MPHTALYRRRHYAGAAVPPATITPIPTSLAIAALGATASITGVTRSAPADASKTVSGASSNETIATVSGSLAIANGATTSTGSIVVTGVAAGAFTILLGESGGGPIASVSGTVTAATGPVASYTISSMAVAQGVAINRDLRQGLSGAAVGGVFTVDPTSAALPAGLTISGNYLIGTTNAAAVPNNGIKFRYTAAGNAIISNAFPIYVLANTAFDSAGRWTPARDPDGTVAALRFTELPLKTWVEIANSNNMALLKPIYDSLGEGWIAGLGTDGYLGKFTNYSGCAVEPGGRRAYFTGGGHEGGADNSVDGWDTATLTWNIVAHPTKIGVDGFTFLDYQFWGSGVHRPWNGTGNILALERSSTGFALWPVGNSFSHFAWMECPGPARFVSNPAEVVFANGDPGSAYNNLQHPYLSIYVYPNTYWSDDIMPDRRPAPIHTYGGFVVRNADELMMVSRAIWRCKLDGSGWIKDTDGGRIGYPTNRFVGELIWALDDTVNNRIIKGGCGSNCSNTTPPAYYYTAATAIDKTTLTASDLVGLLPSTLTSAQLNMGDTFHAYTQAGRDGFWFNRLYAASFNMDTNTATGYDLTGVDLNWNSEGRCAVHVPALGKILRFDTYQARGAGVEPLTCYSMDDPANAGAVGVSGRKPINVAPFAIDATALPNAASFLMYNRIWLYQNCLVYVPFGDTNVFVCRVV